MSEPVLHGAWVRAADAAPNQVTLFLHGILGSGSNLRGLAQAYVQAEPQCAALLVDLRLHGKSRGFAPPHDVRACARDLLALEPTLPWPVTAVVGHSFGGKVALAYHDLRPSLTRVVTLDSDPGARPDRVGSEQTMTVLALLDRLPKTYSKRDEFIAQVEAQGQPRAIAEWLAMNLERTAEGFAFRVDLPGIRALLDSYFSLDLWPVVERSAAQLDVVIGGLSRVWDAAHLARIEGLAREQPKRVHVHLLPDAGHWVHVDAPVALRAALIAAKAQTDTP
ncbi:MAG: putative hydrolase, alpha/beta fold family [Myxococcaceae bacterium]|nr:putative hydrolase, alpha/beta fold family [Myxococcaceae bacterium]